MSNSFKKEKKTDVQLVQNTNNTTPILKQSALHYKHYKMKFPNLLIQGEKDR